MKPLAIIQARLGSTRLPRKVLMEVGGRSLVRRAYDASVRAFGTDNVVHTVPAGDGELIAHILDYGGIVEPWEGDENDVLGRFWAVAHRYRWHPDSVVVRITPDDPFKRADHLKRVAEGERLPVETGGEAFTLEQLDRWHGSTERSGRVWRADMECYVMYQADDREHIGNLIPGERPPSPEGTGWTVDTLEDLEAARERAERDRVPYPITAEPVDFSGLAERWGGFDMPIIP